MFLDHDFEYNVLYEPALKAGDACNELQIVTGYTDCEMISRHLLTLHDGLGRNGIYSSAIKIQIILGMYKGAGITLSKHNKIQTTLNRINTISPHIQTSCRYIYQDKEVHSKVYAWLKDGIPIKAYAGSANYTMNAFKFRREIMVDCESKAASKYYSSLLPDTIDCFEPNATMLLELENSYQKQDEETSEYNYENLSYELLMKKPPLDVLKVSWLTEKGTVGTTSGPNWGIRQKPGYFDKNGKWTLYKRDPNQAYIPYNKSNQKTGFFPDRVHPDDKNCPMFKAVTKNDGIFYMRMAQDNNKALHSAESNALLGKWLRKTLGVPSGAPVRLEDFKRYGKTEITFYKYADDVFVMDF